MKFETKFNLEDNVWLMANNKLVEVTISSIRVFYTGTNQDCISYTAMDIKDPVSWVDYSNLFEHMLFISKEELLNSL